MQVQKILSYDVYGESTGNSYQYVCDLLTQDIDPPSREPNNLNCRGYLVYTSSLKRAVGCIDNDTSKDVIIKKALNEIPFSLEKYCTKELFKDEGGFAVRSAFVTAFIEDNLDVTREQLQREIIEVLALGIGEEQIMLLTHTFRMKLIEVYGQIGSELFTNPGCIKNFIKPETKLFEFGEIINI